MSVTVSCLSHDAVAATYQEITAIPHHILRIVAHHISNLIRLMSMSM